MTEPVPFTREERQATLIEAAGSLDNFAAYIAAGAALHTLASRYPEFLGMNIADAYKEVTIRLDRALRAEERRRGI